MAGQQPQLDMQQQLQLPALAAEAAALLEHELTAQEPSVAKASIIIGLLQERVFANSDEPLAVSVGQYMGKFQEQLVAAAAAKLGPKPKTPQDKVVAIAKFLQGKLAKAAPHKQPLHTQYLTSALRDSGKRQLDCLGIATAVLGLCHCISMQHSTQHADLTASRMVVSDDHCWLALPQQQQQQQQNALLHVEVTDPRVLTPANMSNWLYAGGHGALPCTAQEVIMILIAGLMPEELKDDAAAAAVASMQMGLLTHLAARHPSALLYSNFFRWGMLHEQQELKHLVAAAESGNMGDLQQLALLTTQQLQSQQCYMESIQRSKGMQWHPHSCAAFGWLNRMQAALCGDTDELLALSSSWQQTHATSSNGISVKDLQQNLVAAATSATADTNSNISQRQQLAAGTASLAAAWLQIGIYLFEQALSSLDGCTAVLRHYTQCAGKPDKSADKQLMEAVRDLWQNLADACKAVACLQQAVVHDAMLMGPGQQPRHTQHSAAVQPRMMPAESVMPVAVITSHGKGAQEDANSGPELGGHFSSDVPAAAVTAHNEHLAAAVSTAQSLQLVVTPAAVLTHSRWLQPLVQFMDAICAYFGDESADVPAEFVADFLRAAGLFTDAGRIEAVATTASAQQLQSSRMRALADTGSAAASAWEELGLDLHQLLQMPASRKRKRKEL